VTDLSKYGPWAIVAGASEGIGEHAARQLAADGFSVLLVSRRQPVLDALSASILAEDAAPDVEVRTLALDLGTAEAASTLCGAVADLDVGLLFYNAGADVSGTPFLDRPLDQVMGMVGCNVVTATAATHTLGGRMRDRGRGGIVVISSGAAIAGAALIATYSATKAYQQILCEGLWAELDGTGVDVVCVMAGTTATPAFLRTTAMTADDPAVMDPADVARNALAALGHGPAVGASDELTEMFAGLSTVPRTMFIEGVSSATRATFGLDG